MNPNTHSTGVETIESTYCRIAYAPVFNRGQEQDVEVGKTALDWAVEQNTELLASYNKTLKASCTPGLFLFAWAGQALGGYVSLQNSLLGFAVEQVANSDEADLVHSHNDGKAKATINNLIEQSMERKIDVSAIGRQQTDATRARVQYLDSVQLRMLAKEIVDSAIMPLETAAKPSVN
jgi:hypothetical protein